MKDLIGQVIGDRYRVDAFIGKGGMAEVYKVWDKKRSVHLAMKLLHADLAEDKVFLRRFRREAQTLSKLQHPHIVRFYGLEQEDDLVFMLMDYVEGTTLRKEIFRSKGPFTLTQVLEIMRPVCAALAYAHQAGFVHCDVKPANILIDDKDRVLVSDFGIARMTDAATATMVGAGTPAYMAPEQVRGQDPTPQTDIYTLGVVLYEMLTGGERPFTGEHARTTGTTSEKIRWEQLNLEPPPPHQFNADISHEIEVVLLKALAKQPEERYQDIGEFVEELERLAQSAQHPRVKKVLRRKWLGLLVAVGLVMSLMVFLIILSVIFIRIIGPKVTTISLKHPVEIPIPKITPSTILTPPSEIPLPILTPSTILTPTKILNTNLPVPMIIANVDINCRSGPGLNYDFLGALMAGEKAQVVGKDTQNNYWVIENPDHPGTCWINGRYVTFEVNMEGIPEWIVPPTQEVHSIGSIRTRPADGMQMVYVPEGEFQMGSDSGYPDESPVHTVYLDAFWIDQTEVTNAKYRLCVEAGACDSPRIIGYYSDNAYEEHPVVYVSWNDTRSYCGWAGARLPTEAEWEKAARGGLKGQLYPWGDISPSCNTGADNGAQFNQCYGQIVHVRKFTPNGYGLYDMAGNVWEWVADWFSETYYSSSPASNPAGPASGIYRVLRGGSWYDYRANLRTANRHGYEPDLRIIGIGFRCALSQ